MDRNRMTSDILTAWSAEPWAMEPMRLHALFARVEALGSRIEAVSKIEVARPEPKLDVRDGVAHIPVRGILLDAVPQWFSWFGIDATAYGDIARLTAQAAADPAVRTIQLDVDSPGGTVAGLLPAARAIRAARSVKPLTAQVQNIAASAAYWLASQADRIGADVNDEIGSIGVYTVYNDWSKCFADEGIKVHVIASGEHKGMGVFGAPITDSQIAAMREVIEGIAENFVQAVSEGRGLSLEDTKALATGRLWEAKAALANKLIDVLGPVGPASSNANQATSQSTVPDSGENNMENEKDKSQATAVDTAAVEARGRAAERTRLAEFKAAFPNDLEFAVASFESGATVDQAKASYAILQKRTAKVDSRTGADGRIGAARSEGNESAQSGPDFLAVSRQYAAEHKCSVTEAMKAVQAQDPALHERYLDACQAQARPTKRAKERIEA